jgi:hypothetical protein
MRQSKCQPTLSPAKSGPPWPVITIVSLALAAAGLFFVRF